MGKQPVKSARLGRKPRNAPGVVEQAVIPVNPKRMPDLAQTVYDEDTGKLYQKITQEELAQINAFTQQLLAKRKSPSKRNCALCGDYLAGGGTCQHCEKLSAGCPLCGDGSIKEVCLACIKAGAPHCDLCFRALGEGEGRPCKECKAAKNGLPTPDKFPV